MADAAKRSPPLSAGLSRLFRSGTTPLALSRPPPVAGSIAAKMAQAAMFSRSPAGLAPMSLPKMLWPLLEVMVP